MDASHFTFSTTEDPRAKRMSRSFRSFLLPLVYILSIFSEPALSDSKVSILSTDPYEAQRKCVQFCLWHPGATDDLMPYIGCTSPWLNECLCRSDLASSASYFLTSCVNKGCSSAPQDVSRAVSVYDEYCTRNAPAANVATPTTNGAAPTATQLVVTTIVSSSNAVGGGLSQASSEFWGVILFEATICLMFVRQLLS